MCWYAEKYRYEKCTDTFGSHCIYNVHYYTLYIFLSAPQPGFVLQVALWHPLPRWNRCKVSVSCLNLQLLVNLIRTSRCTICYDLHPLCFIPSDVCFCLITELFLWTTWSRQVWSERLWSFCVFLLFWCTLFAFALPNLKLNASTLKEWVSP